LTEQESEETHLMPIAAEEFAEEDITEGLLAIASAAGAATLACRGSSSSLKADGSPVCHADVEANRIIAEKLSRRWHTIPIISEEGDNDDPGRAPGDPFWLVDPLDGTKEFLKGSTEFTVNIALIVGGAPVAGCVYAPARGRAWLAVDGAAVVLAMTPGTIPALGTARSPLRCRRAVPGEVLGIQSVSHGVSEDLRIGNRLGVDRWRSMGSSLKLMALAEGNADLYPRSSPVMAWDIAAADAVLRAAGGTIVTTEGKPMVYDAQKTGWRVDGFVAAGDPALLSPLTHQRSEAGSVPHRS
jgi:3'(2'), 5'-bisphosphate nucleotidase